LRLAGLVQPHVPLDRGGGDSLAVGVGQLDLAGEDDLALGVEGGQRLAGGDGQRGLGLDRAFGDLSYEISALRASGVTSPIRSAKAPTKAAPEAVSAAVKRAPACWEPT
jgi:hypothetical protein